jgi:3-isopropylmalate/(R)-2-methylmalate dehydratase large subunit
MGQTLAEKILSRKMGRSVQAGEVVFPEPDLVVIHDWYAANAGRVLKQFGVERLHRPGRVMFVTDHEPVALSAEAASRQKEIREVARRFSIGHFFDVGRGGHGHLFPVQAGFVRPGMFVEAYDTHVPNYGAVGALGIALLNEIVEVLAVGSVWIRVPATVRVHVTGRLPDGVSIRDFAQKLIADLDAEAVNYTVVEFAGPALEHISVDARFTLCNTPIEIGAKSVLVEPDAVTVEYLRERVQGELELIRSDTDAAFALVTRYDLSRLEPQVALPPMPDNVVPISDVAGTPINHAFVGSCASGSLSDMRDAARYIKGRKIHSAVRCFITPGTQEIFRQAMAEGLIDIFADAGAIITAPGCGPCAGGKIGSLGAGEVSINTGTRNDYGRLGARDAQIYLASPASVAAAAVTGRIVDPRELSR